MALATPRSEQELRPLLQHAATNHLQENKTTKAVINIDTDYETESKKEAEPSVNEELYKVATLAYPVVLASALEFLPGFTSIILTGHMNSPDAKAYVDAATLSSMFTNITAFSVGFGLISAMDTLCSQAYGANRYEKLGIYFQTGLLVLLVCFLPIFLTNWYSASILVALGLDPTLAELTQEFARTSFFGVPCILLYELYRKVLLAQNITQPLVVFAALGNVVHIASGYWFAYHTSMGFNGIALSRALGNLAMLLLLFPYFQLYPQHFTQWWQEGWNFRESVRHIGVFLELGIPGFLMMCMEWWAFELLSLFAGMLPDSLVAVSAHAVVLNFTMMIFMVFSGLSSASNVRVGNCLGANEPKKAQLVSRLAIGLVLVIGVTLATALFFAANYVPTLFLNDAESIAKAASVLAIWSPFEVLDGLNAVTSGIFRGAGKQQAAATTNAVAYYVGGIPLAVLLAFYWHIGVEGLWFGFGFGICISVSTLQVLLTRWDWQALADDAERRTGV